MVKGKAPLMVISMNENQGELSEEDVEQRKVNAESCVREKWTQASVRWKSMMGLPPKTHAWCLFFGSIKIRIACSKVLAKLSVSGIARAGWSARVVT